MLRANSYVFLLSLEKVESGTHVDNNIGKPSPM